MPKPIDNLLLLCYNVLINGGYVNSFKSYVEAGELRDQLERQFKKSAIITIQVEYIYY